MKILLTGATGYIGKRLLIELLSLNHQVVCCVRDRNRFNISPSLLQSIQVIEVDFLDPKTLQQIPDDIDGAYYLMHSMSSSANYQELEQRSAVNFREAMQHTRLQHVVYLSGIVNEKSLSAHLQSRLVVEQELQAGSYHFTSLRAGIIIGSGSASFEIIRDLVEKLPLMITPKWLNTRCQPVGIRDVIQFLVKTLFNPSTFDENYDIGGPDILTYRQMLLTYAQVRGLTRRIWTVPVMTPKLSSYWLYFVTATSFKLASALVSSMRIEVVCRDNKLAEILQIKPISYKDALERTFAKIEGQQIVSSWKDSLVSGRLHVNLSDFLTVPTHGCFIDQRSAPIRDKARCKLNIWKIGGNNGWYAANSLWRLRGFLDKLVGGVGLRRGRTHDTEINAGDSLDFWRVLYANKEDGRLLLFAEMKLPGEAWLEFRIEENKLYQTATFRPKGLFGRIYWYAVLPFHGYIFKRLIKALVN